MKLCWQSALPVKQALLKQKYGTEVATSPEAKKFLDQDEAYYILKVNSPMRPGGPGGAGGAGASGGAEKAVEMIKQSASLRRKGKEPIAPEKVQFVPRQGGVDMFLMFSKKDAIVEEDKEVEFVFKNEMTGEIKYKFRLKDMIVGDKLAL